MSFHDWLRHPVVAPLNNLLYNTQSSNLALHGVHPYYQHFLINLPILLGPAILLILNSFSSSVLFFAAIFGTGLLSCFSHQEARFLLPAVPLLLSSVKMPRRHWRPWVVSWLLFNVVFSLLMGIFHQGGIVAAQIYIGEQAGISHAYWWKTYSPPVWLLGRSGINVQTVDLMGLHRNHINDILCVAEAPSLGRKMLIAPRSATFLDYFIGEAGAERLQLEEIWTSRTHFSLDDVDIPGEGLLLTLSRVVGRRGLTIWEIRCNAN